MASTTTFGSFPGVKVTVAGGAITGVAVGREQKLVLVGVGDSSAGSASVNDPTTINSRLDADRKFGADTELAVSMKDALANGANIDYLYGVMAEVTSESAESFASTDSGTLANAPIIEDTSTISVQDTTEGASVTPEFRYGSPPTAPSDANTVYINPITAEWTADESNDYEFDYDHPDFGTAIENAKSVIDEKETAVIDGLYENESVAGTASGSVNTLRGQYRMTLGVSAAQPNENSSDNTANFDASSYTTSIDNDAYFLYAPGRKEGSNFLVGGALGGIMAGSPLDESIFNRSLTVDDLEQRILETDANDLRDENVIPIKQPQTGGSITVAGNSSTSTETDFIRDYFTIRLVDQVVLIAKSIGDSVLGRLNNEDTRDTVENQIRTELRGLASDGLIEPGEDDNWFLDVYEVDANTVGIDLGVTPNGVTKKIETEITINT